MTDVILKNLIRFVSLVLFQVLILNNIQLGGYINPYLYIVFILMLPFRIPNWILLILSFMIGITIDIFSNTIGMHAFACVLTGFFRPFVLSYTYSKEDYEYIVQPSVPDIGIYAFTSYTILITLIHHTALFFIEAFGFADLFSISLRILFSSIFTILLVVISQYIFSKNKKKFK